MSFFEDYVEDGLCCMSCGQVIDYEAVGYPRFCNSCLEVYEQEKEKYLEVYKQENKKSK